MVVACALFAIAKSVDITMGFTPLEGLKMGTRSGDVDPGLLQYLCEINKEPIQEIVAMLNQESGLLCVSGLSKAGSILPLVPHLVLSIKLQ